MKKKLWMLALWIIMSILMLCIIVVSEKKRCSVGIALASALITLFIEAVWKAVVDIKDTADWKESQTKLKRGGFIKDSTIVRISFAYLYRIKVGNQYLLVQNLRNTSKYQPVGGVYKFEENEKRMLKNMFHILDDDKIPMDASSKNDYRLRMENRYLRKFIKRFNAPEISRERIENVGREFKEELVKTGVLNWDSISYRYCGRYVSELKFDEHFQIYAIQLFDVVELLPTSTQEQELNDLTKQRNKKILFATSNQINSLGIEPDKGKLGEVIGDHTKFTLQEYEAQLERMPNVGKIFCVSLV